MRPPQSDLLSRVSGEGVVELAHGVRVLIITGLSGAGKTVAVQSLEDLGFFCVDNLPPALIPKFGELVRQSADSVQRVALVCDTRGGEFFKDLFQALDELEEYEIPYQIIYLEADDDSLVRRYKASRRRHPSAHKGRLLDGITHERELLEDVRRRADLVLDTSRLRPADLKDLLTHHVQVAAEDTGMTVHVVSFGFKYGIPIDADLVFDVRFLPNPYYVDHLRLRTGCDRDVYDFVMRSPETERFMAKLLDMLDFLVPEYTREGKAQLVIAIGCTGGRHRSVAIGERLREHLQKTRPVTVEHRDVARDGER